MITSPKQLEIPFENSNLDNANLEFVYLRDGRIVTAYKTEILG